MFYRKKILLLISINLFHFLINILTYHLLKCHRIKVSKTQLSLLVAEVTKAKECNKPIPWAELSTTLNTEGPSIKSTMEWIEVNIKLF